MDFDDQHPSHSVLGSSSLALWCGTFPSGHLCLFHIQGALCLEVPASCEAGDGWGSFACTDLSSHLSSTLLFTHYPLLAGFVSIAGVELG